MRIVCAGKSLDVRLDGETAVLGDRRLTFRARRANGEIVAIEMEGHVIPLRAVREGNTVAIWCRSRTFDARPASALSARPRETGSLVSPMPGRVRRVEVAAGDRVERGQVVVILEAMKMEHAILSPREGVVGTIAFKEGDLVDAGVELVEIE